jgi:hypothetical protein
MHPLAETGRTTGRTSQEPVTVADTKSPTSRSLAPGFAFDKSLPGRRYRVRRMRTLSYRWLPVSVWGSPTTSNPGPLPYFAHVWTMEWKPAGETPMVFASTKADLPGGNDATMACSFSALVISLSGPSMLN